MAGGHTRAECPACELYRHSREEVIKAEIAKTSTGSVAEARWRRLMLGVHAPPLPFPASIAFGPAIR